MLELEITRTSVQGAAALGVHGQIDLTTAAVLEGTLDTAIRESVGALVLDLSGVDFMDSSGVNALLRARALLGREGRDLVLVCPAGPVRHVLETIRIAPLFALFSSPREAAAHLVPAD
jgi:anti-anti-sigma factor